MEKEKLLVFFLFALIVSQIVFVYAAPPTSEKVGAFGEKLLSPFYTYVIGVPSGVSAKEAIMTFAVWLIIFVTFGDIIHMVTAFSSSVSWITAFALSLIAANVGATYGAVKQIFQVTVQTAGYIVAIYLLLSFIAFLLLHFGVSWGYKWFARAKIMKLTARGEQEVLEGVKTLRGISKELEKGRI